VTIYTGAVTTIAGLSGTSGSTDGKGSNARFSLPTCIAMDAAGTVALVGDYNTNIVRRIDVASGDVTTLAGTAGTAGSADGVGAAARFNGLEGIAIDNAGSVAIAVSLHMIYRMRFLQDADS
jgi:hypothetical protein